MKLAVLLNQVPDLVEDLELNDAGTGLASEVLKMKLNEFDDHALEEALLIKESQGAEVVALAIAAENVERMLFTALAKGADRAIRLDGVDPHAGNRTLAQAYAEAIGQLRPDLVLAGVQSPGDREGQLGPLLGALLDWPAVSVATNVKPAGERVSFSKEYSGGIVAEFEARLPAVLGLQAAAQPPRYAPVSRVRQVQQSAALETIRVSVDAVPSGTVTEMAPPVSGRGATMLQDAGDILAILKEKGVL